MAWNDKYLKVAQSEEKHDSAVPLFTETVSLILSGCVPHAPPLFRLNGALVMRITW